MTILKNDIADFYSIRNSVLFRSVNAVNYGTGFNYGTELRNYGTSLLNL